MISFFKYFFENANVNDLRYFPTRTAIKNEIVQKENQFILARIPGRGPQEQMVGVVGHVHGLMLHLDQFRELGFQDENIFLFELDETMYPLLKSGTEMYKGFDALKQEGLTKSFLVKGNIFYPPIKKPEDRVNYNIPDDFMPGFDRLKVTHVDADITTKFEEEEFFKNVRLTYIMYPNAKSSVYVHSLRALNLRSSKIEKELEDLEKLEIFLRAIYLTKEGTYGTDRVSEFRTVYELYRSKQEGEELTGKKKFIEKLKKLYGSNFDIKIQSYRGAGKSGKGAGGSMISFTFVKSPNGVLDIGESLFAFELTSQQISSLSKHFKDLENFFNLDEEQRNNILKPYNLKITDQELNNYIDLMDNLQKFAASYKGD